MNSITRRIGNYLRAVLYTTASFPLSIAFFVLPLMRLLAFRATGLVLPITALTAPYILAALAISASRAGSSDSDAGPCSQPSS